MENTLRDYVCEYIYYSRASHFQVELLVEIQLLLRWLVTGSRKWCACFAEVSPVPWSESFERARFEQRCTDASSGLRKIAKTPRMEPANSFREVASQGVSGVKRVANIAAQAYDHVSTGVYTFKG